MQQQQSLTQQYVNEQRPTIVPRMLAAIDRVHSNTTWIARGALAVTTPHQILFIGSLGHGGSPFEVITAWFFAALIPAITDLGMLTMLKITQTAGMARTARQRALIVLVVLVTESAVVNFLAPGHVIFRVLVAFAAVVLAAVEWVASAVRADFAEMESAEAELTAVAVPVADPAEETRRAQRRAADRARRVARREAAQREAEEAAAKRALAAERRRETLAAKKAAAAETPAPQPVVPPQSVHVVVPTRPRTGAFGLPRRPLGEQMSVLGGAT